MDILIYSAYVCKCFTKSMVPVRILTNCGPVLCRLPEKSPIAVTSILSRVFFSGISQIFCKDLRNGNLQKQASKQVNK